MNLWELASGPIIPVFPPPTSEINSVSVGGRGKKEEKEEAASSSPSWLKSIFLKETRQYSFCEKGIRLYAKGQ